MRYGKALGILIPFVLLGSARAQQPRIASLFPGGATAGKSVDVQIHGGNLIGVHGFLVGGGPGVTAEVVGGANPVDEAARPIFQSKCTSCHEARSPENRSMSPEQWADTVKRMIAQHGADIVAPDRDRIVGYLQGMAKAGQIAARITVAPGTPPGMRELRLLTDHGVSTATTFEVGDLPEITSVYKTNKSEDAATVTLPVAINGTLAQSGESDWFRFPATKGQRLTFNLKAERLNPQAAAFFFPTLHLFDANGTELAKNLGKYGVDPFLQYTVPADGTYLIQVHDLLWHGNPASIYRLTMGEIVAEGVLSPSWAHPGETVSAQIVPTDATLVKTSASPPFALHVPAGADGVTIVTTPVGDAPLLVSDLTDGGVPNGVSAPPIALPALFRGAIGGAGQTDTFAVHAPTGGMTLDLYAQRIGSPLHGQVTVRAKNGEVVAQRTADEDADVTLPNAFPQPGDYTVEIGDAEGAGGATYRYCWEATSSRVPDLHLTVAPDVANLSPGTSTTLRVQIDRRHGSGGIERPMTLRVSGLPPGVTAAPAVLLPDMNEAVVVLTASPDAAGGTGNLSVVEGTLMTPPKHENGAEIPITRPAHPNELYSVNNNQLVLPRTTLAIAVQATSPAFTLDVAKGMSELTLKDGKDVAIPITITRRDGFKGSLFVSVQGLPGGIYPSQGNYNIPPDKTEATIVLHVDHNARFFRDKPVSGMPPVHIVIAAFIANNGTDQVPALTSPPITLTPQ